MPGDGGNAVVARQNGLAGSLAPDARRSRRGGGAAALVLRCLVAARAEVDFREASLGRTALWIAASLGHADAVETLHSLNADVNATAEAGSFNNTPIWIAAQEGYTAVIETLGPVGSSGQM